MQPDHFDCDVKALKVLDCTLRDGGNVNGWSFDWPTVKRVTFDLASAGVDYIEVGYFGGSGSNQVKNPGPTHNCNRAFFEQLDPSEFLASRIAVMLTPKRVTLEQLREVSELPVGLVRVAAYPWDFPAALASIEFLARQGLVVSMNIMAISYASLDSVATMAREACSAGATCFYVVDSFGALTPERVPEYISAALQGSLTVGFHGHNNLGLALSNAYSATAAGAGCLDASVRGMARGAGNVPLEMLLAGLHKRFGADKYDFWRVARLADEVVQPLMPTRNSDASLMNIACGLYDLHYYFSGPARQMSARYDVSVEALLEALGRLKPTAVNEKLVESVAQEMAGVGLSANRR